MAQKRQKPEAPSLDALLRQSPYRADLWKDIVDANCHARVGHASPVIGRESVLDMLDSFFSVVTRVDSSFAQSWTIGEAQIIESEAAFLNQNGTIGSTPCICVARCKRGVLRDLRIVLDPSAIWNWPFRISEPL